MTTQPSPVRAQDRRPLRTAVVLAVVLLILLTALPLGMVMGSCPNAQLTCGPVGFGTCAAVFLAALFLVEASSPEPAPGPG